MNFSSKNGVIEIICGSMFSGKTEELLRRIKRASIATLRVQTFKPIIDNRYDNKKIISHDANFVQSIAIKNVMDILNYSKNTDVFGIDEAQFFDDKLLKVALELADKGKRVIIAGLDMDFAGKPFGTMPYLLAVADEITKVHAICVQCKGLALYSYRLNKNKEQVVLGNEYEPRCRKCFNKN